MSDYRLLLSYDDGVTGEVDLSEFVGKGVFQKWKNSSKFDTARVGEFNEIVWEDDIDMCGDALYMRLTGKPLNQVFDSKSVPVA